MAKLLMVVTGETFYIMSEECRRRNHKYLKKYLEQFANGTGECSSLTLMMPKDTKVQLFKIEDDGVEELTSVDVHYHNEDGERIEIEEAKDDQPADKNP